MGHARKFSPIRSVFGAARVGAGLVLLFSVAVLIGHLTGMHVFSHQTAVAPVIDPVVVMMAGLLGAGLFLVTPMRRVDGAVRAIFLVAAGLAVTVLVEQVSFGPPRMAAGSIFAGLPRVESRGAVGLNTLVAGLLIASGQLLRSRFARMALVTAGLAAAMPLLALIGYGFGLDALQGGMSPIAAALFLPLSLIGVLSFLRHPAVRPLFADTFLGRSARAELLAGLGFPLTVGALLAQRNPDGAAVIAIQAALMALFAGTVVLVKTRSHAATEIERQHSVRALQEAAVTDHLTGLANRLGASTRIDALAPSRSVGVIIADLDNFKDFNDIWGHAAGDRVLVEVARSFKERLGSGEIVARWGGEEFLVALPGRDLDATLAVAEDLRAGLAALRGPGGAFGEITASFGVSERFALEAGLDGAIYRADVALYNAKDAGRDKVVRDSCAGCNTVSTAAFRRELILSDQGAMGCGCTMGAAKWPESASKVSTPDPGSWN